MVRSIGLFSQVVSEICSRVDFEKFVEKHAAERATKGFTCKTQLISMLFCHFAKVDSLRAISYGLEGCNGNLSHLDISAPKRSILSYANATVLPQHFRITISRCLNSSGRTALCSGASISSVSSQSSIRSIPQQSR